MTRRSRFGSGSSARSSSSPSPCSSSGSGRCRCSGERYLAAAQNNQLRTIRIEAPRGPISDYRGRKIVGQQARQGRARLARQPPAIPDTTARLPPAQRDPRHAGGRAPAGLPRPAARRPTQAGHARGGVSTRRRHVLSRSAVRSSRGDDRADLHSEYPRGSIAAQLIGHVGTVTPEQVKSRRYQHGDHVGQSGSRRRTTGTSAAAPGSPRCAWTRSAARAAGPATATTSSRASRSGSRSTAKLQRAAELALDPRNQRRAQGRRLGRERRRIVALDPRTGEVGRWPPTPTFDPRLYVGKPNPTALRPAARPRGGQSSELPRAEPRDRRPLSAGLDLQARDRARGDARAARLGLHAAAVHGLDGDRRHDVQQLEPLIERGDDDADRNRRVVRHLLLPTGPRLLPAAGAVRKPASEVGVGLRLRQGERPRRRRRGGRLLPTPQWRRKTYKSEIDKLWKSGDSVQLAIGQKDLLVTPLQMARFYALVANGGKLVTPHLVSSVEQPGNRGATRRVFAPAPRQVNVQPDELRASVRAVPGNARELRDLFRCFGSFPVPSPARRARPRRRSSGSFQGMSDQSWWCGYGPTDATPRARRLRGDRERRPRRHRRSARRSEGVRELLRHEGSVPALRPYD